LKTAGKKTLLCSEKSKMPPLAAIKKRQKSRQSREKFFFWAAKPPRPPLFLIKTPALAGCFDFYRSLQRCNAVFAV
jgi:hypothetical protein